MLLLFWLAPLLRFTPNRKVCIALTLVIVGFQFASVIRWGSNPALDALLNQAFDRAHLVLLADVSGGGATQSAVRHEYRTL
ncbi:Uncharacterised protein [Serratia marcescens]|uniref:Uncharacterized protein n=1 Tax=Serratia marcescens TaxID=615 RepID=A0A379Z9K7_SERMA|nr:Uncharacterised protein [Serratia marcescens]